MVLNSVVSDINLFFCFIEFCFMSGLKKHTSNADEGGIPRGKSDGEQSEFEPSLLLNSLRKQTSHSAVSTLQIYGNLANLSECD